MKLFTFTLLFAVVCSVSFGQQDIVDKVFSNKPAEFRNAVQIENKVEGYFTALSEADPSYSVTFGLQDYKAFYIYKHTVTNKRGLIVLGENVSAYTDPVADSIYFLQLMNFETEEFYDDLGNYVYRAHAKEAQFYFEMPVTDELWTATQGASSYTLKKAGEIYKDLFKAISFSESVADGYSVISAVYANLRTKEVVNSTILNQRVTVNEVYAYHYDYYGEYDYYYGYETPETDYSVPYFETRLNYEPIEIAYSISGDTIGEVMFYNYAIADPNAYWKKTIPDNFQGVWATDSDSLLIIDGDDFWSGYGLYISTVDTYKDNYFVGQVSLADAVKRMNLSQDDQRKLEAGWSGSKSDVRLIECTAWNIMSRYRDYYLSNESVMVHVYQDLDESGNKHTGFEFLKPEKVYHDFGYAVYDSYNYATNLKNEAGEQIDLYSHGVDYYYNYNPQVAERNIDKNGNLVLTTESLGTLTFKSYSNGNNYVGRVKYQWIGSPTFSSDASIVSIKSEPYKMVDETGRVLVDDIASMYVVNVAGFNLYQIYNSANKVGVLGPDGNWMIKPEWDAINILGPNSGGYSYEYDGYSGIGLPVFFEVYTETKHGLLDSKGNWVLPMEYETIYVCSGQIVAMRDGKVSVFSFDGKKLLDGIDGFGSYYYTYSTDCYSFDYTHAGSRIISKNNLLGIVDKDFNLTVDYKYTSISPIGNRTEFLASNEEGKLGIINAKDEVLLPFEYDYIVPFDYYPDKLIASKDGLQGVINTRGDVLIPFQFYSITSSSDWNSNMIYISDPDYRTNIIDTTGKSFIDAECSYLYLYYTMNMFYCSGTDGQYSFYDINGNLLYSKIASYIDPYSAYDYVQIYQIGDYENPKFGAFDLSSGADMMPAEFESLYPFWINDQMFFAGTKGGKIGIYSIDGTELVKPKGMYLDNYYYNYGDYGTEAGYFVEISNKKGKSKVIRLDW